MSTTEIIISFIIALIVAFIVVRFGPDWQYYKERFHGFFPPKKNNTLKDERKARNQPLKLGNIVLPIKILVGGDGKIKYRHPEGITCKWNPYEQRLVLPSDIQEAYNEFLEKRRKQAEDRGAVFEQRDHVRLDDYRMRLFGREELPYPLILHVSRTDYFTIQATNYSIDEHLPGGQTIREKYAQDPFDLRGSVLGNPLAVNLSVVTSDRKIYIVTRSRKTATTPRGLAPAISGTGDPDQDIDDSSENYSPFLTAQREAEDEICSFKPLLNEVTFFGLARTLRFQLPFLFGELRLTNTTSRQLESNFSTHKWETEALIAIPFKPNDVINFITEVYREMTEKAIIGSATYAGIFSLLESLCYEYPNEWQDIIERLMYIKKRDL